MESERFKQLYQIEPNLYVDNAPVIIEKGSLLLDSQTHTVLAQIKFHSLSEKIIKALKIRIKTYYTSGEVCPESVVYEYLDMKIQYGGRFGSNKAILLKDLSIRSFSIDSYSVVYEDKTVEEVKGTFKPLPVAKELQEEWINLELQKQYCMETTEEAKYIPIHYQNLWRCTCGEWNLRDTCSVCQSEKEKIFGKLNVQNLTVAMEDRLKKEEEEREEQRKREEEEAQRQEAIRQEEEIKRKRLLKKVRRIAAPVILVGIFAFGIYPSVIKPGMDYKHAKELLSEEKFDDSIDAFEALGDYKDSADMITEAMCLKAKNLLDKKEYDAATEIYEALGKEDAVKEVTYQEAKNLMSEEKYEDAKKSFEYLNYKDSKDQYNECIYQTALIYMNDKYYGLASETFEDIDNYKEYKDSLSKIGECKYLSGLEYLDEGDYDAALKDFEAVKEYDNAEIEKEAEGKIAECEEKIKESYYGQANQLIDNKDYEGAIELLEKCEDYKDAKQKIEECEDAINKSKIETLFPTIKFYVSPDDVEKEFGEPDKVNDQTNYFGTKQHIYQYSNYCKLDEMVGKLNFVFEDNQNNEWSLQNVYWESNDSSITQETYFDIERYLSKFWGVTEKTIEEEQDNIIYNTTYNYNGTTSYYTTNSWNEGRNFGIGYSNEEDMFGKGLSISLTVSVKPSEE